MRCQVLALGVLIISVVVNNAKSDNFNQTADSIWHYEWSCKDSKYARYQKYCDMVNWRSAQVRRWRIQTDSNNITYITNEDLNFETIDSFASQAQSHGDLLPEDDGSSGGCWADKLRMSCGYFFRRCRAGRPAMIPQDLCESVCEDYSKSCMGSKSAWDRSPLCKNVFTPDSESWQCNNNTVLMETDQCQERPRDADCVRVPEEGFFLLDIEYGPYGPIPYIYAFSLFAWSMLGLVQLWRVYRDNATRQAEQPAVEPNNLLRTLLAIPASKGVYVAVSLAFWVTCEQWGECSYWLNVGRINCKLVYETVVFLCFLLLSKGWYITRRSLTQQDLRRSVLIVCLFYLGDSLLTVLSSFMNWFYWALTSVIYLFVLIAMLMQISGVLSDLSSMLLQLEIESDLFRRVLTKFQFVLRYRLLMTFFVLSVILSRGLFNSLQNVPLWPQYLALESMEVVVITTLFIMLGDSDGHLFGEVGDLLDALGTSLQLAPVMTADMDLGVTTGKALDSKKERVVIVQNPGGEYDMVVGVRSHCVNTFLRLPANKADTISPAEASK